MPGLLVVTAFLAVATGALHVFGIAGYRGGFAISAALLAGAGSLIAGRALSGVAQRGTWVVAVVIIGVVVAAALLDRAPLSTGRLRAEADRVDLSFYRLESERATGNSRCRPCPAVERRYAGPDLIVEAALIEVAAALATAGYPLEVSVDARRTGRLHTEKDDVAVDVAVRRAAGETDVRLTFRNA